MKPVYKHPYNDCEFIASVHLFGRLYDIYRITGDYRTESEYLVRYGNEPWNYSTNSGDTKHNITKYKGNNLLFLDSAVCDLAVKAAKELVPNT